VANARSTAEIIAACSTPSSHPLGCARPEQIPTAQENPHDHQARGEYLLAMHASNAGDAKYDVMVHSHVGSVNGTSIQKRVVIRNLLNELYQAESELLYRYI
jgi:hypothetical protein